MVKTFFAVQSAPAVPIVGEEVSFPVRRIYCVGRNYAAHRREMGGDDREPPFFFAKPADAVVLPGARVPYPSATAELHHEIELVIALGEGGAGIPVESALDLVFGYAVGVDLTRRDLQAAARAKGQPWEAAKGFDHSAPLSAIRPALERAPPRGRIQISVNGQIRQDSRLDQMIWNVAEIISQASELWRLAPGDLIFTGTPEGVGPLRPGDAVEGEIEDVGALSFVVT
ncbi:MAG: fumarylacetoacetate hydrolase family protein [Caulobacteraceae bacterium]